MAYFFIILNKASQGPLRSLVIFSSMYLLFREKLSGWHLKNIPLIYGGKDDSRCLSSWMFLQAEPRPDKIPNNIFNKRGKDDFLCFLSWMFLRAKSRPDKIPSIIFPSMYLLFREKLSGWHLKNIPLIYGGKGWFPLPLVIIYMMCEHYLCAHALLAVETVQEFLWELAMKPYASQVVTKFPPFLICDGFNHIIA